MMRCLDITLADQALARPMFSMAVRLAHGAGIKALDFPHWEEAGLGDCLRIFDSDEQVERLMLALAPNLNGLDAGVMLRNMRDTEGFAVTYRVQHTTLPMARIRRTLRRAEASGATPTELAQIKSVMLAKRDRLHSANSPHWLPMRSTSSGQAFSLFLARTPNADPYDVAHSGREYALGFPVPQFKGDAA